MNDTDYAFHDLKPLNYELFILAVTALLLTNMVLIWLSLDDAIVDTVIRTFNVALALILFMDFIYRLRTAPSARRFFLRGGGWLDLLGCVPVFPFAVFRLYRMVWTIRRLRRMGQNEFLGELATYRAGGALYLIIFLVILLLEISSTTIVGIESNNPDANIKTASDAIWWAYVTVTTVGYGDYYPVTNWGRLVGIGLMTIGVGLFTGLTGFLANSFFSDRERAAGRLKRKRDLQSGAPATPMAEIQEFRALLEQQQQANAKLQARLLSVEAMLQAVADQHFDASAE